MIVVTGGAGFIGGRLVEALRAGGHEVLVVDHRGGEDPDRYLAALRADPGAALAGVRAVLHQGAISSTTETDEALLRRTNRDWSIGLVDACRAAGTPLVLASSAAVYGTSPSCREQPDDEAPRNLYARFKLEVDHHVRSVLRAPGSQVVALRYFNVYGPGEGHKGAMASVAHQLVGQLLTDGRARIFGAGEGAPAGGHARDFVHVDDVVAVVRWFLDHPDRSGVFNCGTGTARTFAELAGVVVATVGHGQVEHVPFPPELVGRYQARTCADLTRLRAAGCDHRFEPMASGVERYVRWLLAGDPAR